ncbi:IS66-like element accessory protein TnpA [Paracidovorax konjaci]|uniref:Transposase n=1 Tax=Paracidovorax konjaci TaxID=32040 RepID=A0A1I1U157_9BURK|nr:transposase [Paracidovorax konjaci]SFD62423.1 transposase [Paracidovorax konjaci]
MQVNPKQRRRHSAAFKAQVLAACAEPGASVAAVALAFKLNDNLVHQWRRGRGAPKTPGVASMGIAEAPRFIELTVPLAVPPAPAPPESSPSPTPEMITLEFKRGALGISVTWPVSAAADCAAWLREVLR